MGFIILCDWLPWLNSNTDLGSCSIHTCSEILTCAMKPLDMTRTGSTATMTNVSSQLVVKARIKPEREDKILSITSTSWAII